MKNNETGEFELVVGDRHLLVAFFIVVLLCGVAFAMGYVVGQNVPRSGKPTAETVSPSTSSTAASDSRPQPLPPAPAPTAATTTPEADKSSEAPQPTTQPAQASQPLPPPAAEPAAPAPAPLARGLVAPEDLPAGNFWQVMAVAQPQAEVLQTTLRDHKFAVVLSPGPKGLTRVLVGPYPDTQAMGKAKTDLENAGFRPVRYKP